MKPKVVVIVGPTASGKTALSIELAKKINGEIISSDSMQIYKDMDIGTAKVTKEEADGIKHYLVDCVSPDERYTVSDFKRDAENAIKEILEKGKIPIVVGGTGLYVNSLIYGIEYQDMKFDEIYRNELMEKAESEEERITRCRRISFYEKCGLCMSDVKILLFGVEYSMMYWNLSEKETEQEIISVMQSLYKKSLPRPIYEKMLKIL